MSSISPISSKATPHIKVSRSARVPFKSTLARHDSIESYNNLVTSFQNGQIPTNKQDEIAQLTQINMQPKSWSLQKVLNWSTFGSTTISTVGALFFNLGIVVFTTFIIAPVKIFYNAYKCFLKIYALYKNPRSIAEVIDLVAQLSRFSISFTRLIESTASITKIFIHQGAVRVLSKSLSILAAIAVVADLMRFYKTGELIHGIKRAKNAHDLKKLIQNNPRTLQRSMRKVLQLSQVEDHQYNEQKLFWYIDNHFKEASSLIQKEMKRQLKRNMYDIAINSCFVVSSFITLSLPPFSIAFLSLGFLLIAVEYIHDNSLTVKLVKQREHFLKHRYQFLTNSKRKEDKKISSDTRRDRVASIRSHRSDNEAYLQSFEKPPSHWSLQKGVQAFLQRARLLPHQKWFSD